MSYRELTSYRKAFSLAMKIFEISKSFPSEEKYSLTDKIRRSSRSVCSNIDEAYRKRRYPKHFISKLSDSDGENTETQAWFDFALACKYIDKVKYQEFVEQTEEVGKLINYMMSNPDKLK